jgi:hypothetical protein
MSPDIARQVADLEQMTVGQLHERYAEVFGEPVRSRHRRYLIRRIAWRLQANAEGGPSERALRRAEELANIADVRVTPPKVVTAEQPVATFGGPRVLVSTDPRLPPPGTTITRKYKGRTISVTVLPQGFEHDGERYRSLTAVARVITGQHVNGFRLFGLGGKA